MSEEEPQEPEFLPDLSGIIFPGDKITVGQMRQLQPEVLASHRVLYRDWAKYPDIQAIDVVSCEHILARKAWAKAAGLPDPHSANTRSNIIPYLNNLYMQYGISSGKAHTLELVRSIERQAAHFARKSTGIDGRE